VIPVATSSQRILQLEKVEALRAQCDRTREMWLQSCLGGQVAMHKGSGPHIDAARDKQAITDGRQLPASHKL
jgi:hypothetical protein